MDIILPRSIAEQPPLFEASDNELHVAITSLSIGGAERIVLDWARRIHPKWRVHLIVIKDRDQEWPVPSFVRLTRLHNTDVIRKLEELGRAIAQSGRLICLCHLFNEKWRAALMKGGANVIPVLHNAKDGWPEDAGYLSTLERVITVSEASRNELRDAGYRGDVSVIRHIPPRWNLDGGAREKFRDEWNIPRDATVIGMIGAVKPQKNYPFALRVLREVLRTQDVYLAIIGGPVNMKDGPKTWHGVVAEATRLGVRRRLAMPGFIAGATRCLPAFDIVLNTSHFEGLSIATLEALVNGKRIVASKVGGQGEIASDGLTLLSPDEPPEVWAEALIEGLGKSFTPPAWADFPSYRLWTLAHIAHPYVGERKTLFVTANLNSGGAQRSLVNLVCGLRERISLEIMVAGNSSTPYFWETLRGSGIPTFRGAENWNAFDYAESVIAKACGERFGTICFWNVNPRVKLLVTKALAFTDVRLVDVSPGGYGFDELSRVDEFAQLVTFSAEEYYERLNALVLKYAGDHPPSCAGKTQVIKNGVPEVRMKRDYGIHGAPQVVVCGRIAPSKFLLEIIEAMRLVRMRFLDAMLHVFGGAEADDGEYAERVMHDAATKLGDGAQFYGVDFDASAKFPDFDVYVVLGKHQGCPNALLEALAVGMPAIGNDDGGTREQLIDGVTGLLVPTCDPRELAAALTKLFADRALRERLGTAGRAHVLREFSMAQMVNAYAQLLGEEHAGTERVGSALADETSPRSKCAGGRIFNAALTSS